MKIKMNIELIKDFMEKNKLSKKQLAKDCSISVPTLNKILSSNPNFKCFSALRLAKRMKVRVSDIFMNDNSSDPSNN
jgi:DNA-binding XRE family transcriptional regulator